MLFDAKKCKCVQYGHNNRHYDLMGEDHIQTLHEEKDLGVIITDKLEVTEQCAKTSKMANARYDQQSHQIQDQRGSATFIQVRSYTYLDYCSQACRPLKQKDINLLDCTTKGNQDDTGLVAYGLP